MDPIVTEIMDGETWEEALSRSVVTVQILGILSKMSLYLPGMDVPKDAIQFLG